MSKTRPPWSESWVAKRGEPYAEDALSFLFAEASKRLDECEKTGDLPRLADIQLERIKNSVRP